MYSVSLGEENLTSVSVQDEGLNAVGCLQGTQQLGLIDFYLQGKVLKAEPERFADKANKLMYQGADTQFSSSKVCSNCGRAVT